MCDAHLTPTFDQWRCAGADTADAVSIGEAVTCDIADCALQFHGACDNVGLLVSIKQGRHGLQQLPEPLRLQVNTAIVRSFHT